MRREIPGTFVATVGGGESVRAFVPNALPPVPEIDFTRRFSQSLERATHAGGRLETVIPDFDGWLAVMGGFVAYELDKLEMFGGREVPAPGIDRRAVLWSTLTENYCGDMRDKNGAFFLWRAAELMRSERNLSRVASMKGYS